MHYTGMAAMQMDLALRYDPAVFALSIVVAVVLATLALWIRFGLRNLRGRLHRHVLGLISASVVGNKIKAVRARSGRIGRILWWMRKAEECEEKQRKAQGDRQQFSLALTGEVRGMCG